MRSFGSGPGEGLVVVDCPVDEARGVGGPVDGVPGVYGEPR